MFKISFSRLLLALSFVLCGLIAQAQPGKQDREQRKERIEAARATFLTEKMQLTTEQAQKFWPVYNEFDAKRRELRKKSRVFREEDLDALNDAQLREGILQMLEFRQKEVDLEKAYVDKFLAVISARQLATLYKSEKEFMHMLLKRMDDKRQGGKP